MANESDYELACLLMVFVAVSIPTLAKKDVSVFKASLEGKYNYNFKIIYRKVIECLRLFGMLFYKFQIYHFFLLSHLSKMIDFFFHFLYRYCWLQTEFMKTSNFLYLNWFSHTYIQNIYTYIYACITGNLSNCHCLAKAVNQIAGALFTIHGPGDVSDRLQEFLAVSLPPRKKK